MSSPVWTATVQASALAAVSNGIGQIITNQRTKGKASSSISLSALVRFMIVSGLCTPPNYKFQLALEKHFPSDVGANGSMDRKSIINTVIKLAIDQTVALVLNCVFYIVGMCVLEGNSYAQIKAALKQGLGPMIRASYKFWPAVTLLNLVAVPVEQRTLVGNIAGFFWGIYVSFSDFA
ncbi:hypothetical protein P175DRAFT_0502082 [Aspergillus ochraceoroseus IBT 24754]|uniref:Mpv17/PMP22 family protein n=1 Tax=Aspergillus ochraceoroseus IBT 24754 TaxID=1392256 RepID=A0A2T5LUG9_9EURO|nr:uncharacterized protein P175DRAFT_0502082 [Aspergillus ochraceoroseus IBT 24754]PTU19920.1 hypothetical protein P175DRAFT_0502082 [Aspergillus ochraceoroseus IBT 24754]